MWITRANLWKTSQSQFSQELESLLPMLKPTVMHSRFARSILARKMLTSDYVLRNLGDKP